tara:strand:+ start:623 stop:859 length:237 start_codon:yes stop_codon:yes gene_type:complete
MITIRDIYGESDETFEVLTYVDSSGVEIDLGNKYRHPTSGAAILLENQKGNPVLVVWADPESEEPTHKIELDGLRSES